VGEEFRAVVERMKIGRTMEESLQVTADKLGTPEFQFFVITLAIQRETGGNLAETLSNLADVLRKRAQMKLKIKAMSSESKGLGLHRRLAAVHRLHPDLVGQSVLPRGFFSEDRLIVAGLGGSCG
jgi:tight adherence protein B